MEYQGLDEILSPGRIRVLRCLARGYSNEEIADYLLISKNTVAKHVYELLKRLRLHRRSQLVIYALKADLIGLDEIELPGEREAILAAAKSNEGSNE